MLFSSFVIKKISKDFFGVLILSIFFSVLLPALTSVLLLVCANFDCLGIGEYWLLDVIKDSIIFFLSGIIIDVFATTNKINRSYCFLSFLIIFVIISLVACFRFLNYQSFSEPLVYTIFNPLVFPVLYNLGFYF